MSKTVEELARIYDEAYWRVMPGSGDVNRHEGVKAIVRALRDEVAAIWTTEDMACGTILDVFNEILDSGAGADAARKAYWDKHYGVDEPTAPATDPAPVCEWTRISEFDTVIHYSTPHGVMNDLHLWRGLQCSACHAPIKFTEAKT